MAISDKLEYLNDTKQLLKDKINNLGGSIDDNTTFRQYANQLQNVYDNLPKTSFQTGTEVTLENCLKGKLDYENGVVGIGDTKQDTTQGINMLDLSNFSAETTINGVKFTPIENGGIKINGTATANAILEFAFSLVLNGNYTMATKLDGTFTNNESPQVILRSSNATVIYNSGMQQNAIKINTFNNINSTIDKVRIVAVNGSTYNCIIYPMCLSGIYNADNLPNFEKFTGNSPSPSPPYPQEIKYVRGRNLVESKNVKSITTGYSDVLFTQADLKPNTTYTISFEGVAGNKIYANENLFILEYMTIPSGRASLVVTTKATISKNTRTQYQEENGGWLIFKNNGDGNPTANVFDNLQIEEGTQATPYLPYNTIEEVVSGKNLFDDSNHKNKDVPSSAGFYINNAPFNLSGGTYRFGVFVDNQLITTPALMALSFKSGGTTVLEKNNPNQDITITDEQASIIDRVSLYFNGTFVSTYSGKKITGVMITTSEITTYEPYKTPKTYQFSLGDYKFYGIGNYRDYILRTTGKNLFDKDKNPDNYYLDASGEKVYISSNDFINQEYSLSGAVTISFTSRSTGSAYVRVCEYNGSTFIKRTLVSASGTYTLSANCNKVIFSVDSSPSTYFNNLMIEIGSTASDYQPYGVGNWYKVGKIEEYTFTGQEDWTRIVVTGKPLPYFRLYLTSQPLGIASTSSTILSNRYKGGTDAELVNNDYPTISMSGNANNQLNITQNLATADEFKAYLTNNPTYVCYPRVTAEFTPITGTLAEQLEEWWNGQSLDGTTIIEGNGDLPMIIKVRGLKGE